MTEHDGLRSSSAAPLPARVPLRAGPLALVLEDGDLRDLRVGEIDVVQRLHVTVRDANWGTVEPVISELAVVNRGNEFDLQYVLHHRDGTIDMRWVVTATGTSDGVVRFCADGEVLSSFERSRLGVCVLHPIDPAAGCRVRAEHVDGTVSEQNFPAMMAREQPVPGFEQLSALAHEFAPGRWCRVAFEGEVFETEDQRNWIDASFKTYSTPLALPVPVRVTRGARITQQVTLQISSDAPPDISHDGPAVHLRTSEACLELTGEPARMLPAFGVALSDPHGSWDDELSLLEHLRLDHVRVDLRPHHDDVAARLAAARQVCTRLGCGLELAVHLRQGDPGALNRLDRRAFGDARIERVLVFTRDRHTTDVATLDAVRRWQTTHALADVPLASGTVSDFYRISLSSPPPADALVWMMQPQAHATDVTSILQTPPAAREQLRAVRHHHPGIACCISPVRFAPPGNNDARLQTMVGAAWTLAMLAALTMGEAASATWFESNGPAGLVERNLVSPAFHVLAAGRYPIAASALPLRVSHAQVAALWLQGPTGDTLTVANLSRDVVRLEVPAALREGRASSMRRLEEARAPAWRQNPRWFIEPGPHAPAPSVVDLTPLGVVRIAAGPASVA